MTDKASNQQAVAITVGGGESNHIWRWGGTKGFELRNWFKDI
jgi:hypothetical protein